jgi:hypothetical protein
MVYFDASNPSVGTEYHDVIINDPLLTEHGFTKFKLPIDGNAIKMILYNDKDPSMIIYIDFDRHNLDKSVKLLHDKLIYEQQIESKAGKDTLEGLVAYFRNACVSLQEDQNNDFFKNGKTKPKSNKKSSKKQQQQEGQNEEKDKEKKKAVYIQKYYDGDLLAEAIVIGRKPRFAVVALKVGNPEQASITSQDSIQIDDNTILKPFELSSYINKPYVFKVSTKRTDMSMLLLKEEYSKNNVRFRVLTPTDNQIMQIIQELKKILPELDIRSLNESTESNKVTILLSDRKECLIVCIQDDTKDNVYEAVGLSMYCNTKSIILSYLAIFEILWKQSLLVA